MMAQKSLLANVFTWKYGNIDIPASQIFLLRKNVVGLVNIKPTVAGHVIVCPRRNVTRLRDLNEIETVDLWLSATEVHKIIEDLYKV
jgi:bis(5'-adenosyl)-triphosphatase